MRDPGDLVATLVHYISIGKMVQKEKPAGGVSCGFWLEVTIMCNQYPTSV